MQIANYLARNLLAQEPGRDNRHATAANIPNIAQSRPKAKTRGTIYRVELPGDDAFHLALAGREKWALDQLRKAGATGCTPIDNPAPRWSAYIFSLREAGLNIETIHEPHGGDYPGHHGRYVLRCDVRPAHEGGAS